MKNVWEMKYKNTLFPRRHMFWPRTPQWKRSINKKNIKPNLHFHSYQSLNLIFIFLIKIETKPFIITDKNNKTINN